MRVKKERDTLENPTKLSNWINWSSIYAGWAEEKPSQFYTRCHKEP